LDGDVRNMVMMKDGAGKQLLIVGKNNAPVQVLKVND
jgi:hypothetical protein